MKSRFLFHVGISVGGLLIVVLYFFPVVWITVTSFKSGQEVVRPIPTLIPESFTLQQYIHVFTQSNFGVYLKNSLIVSSTVALLTVLLTSTGAYAISQVHFFGKRFVADSFLLAYLFPGVLLIIPMFGAAVKAGVYNTLFAVIASQVLYTFPFGIWTLKEFFDNVPVDLAESARIDGAGELKILFRVFMPLVAPGLGTVLVYSFILSWNEYVFTLILLDSDNLKTVSLGLASWADSTILDWGAIAAAAVMSVIPAAGLFAFVNRYFTKGLTAGSIKG